MEIDRGVKAVSNPAIAATVVALVKGVWWEKMTAALIAVLVLLAGCADMPDSGQGNRATPSPSPTPTLAATPSPSPTPTLAAPQEQSEYRAEKIIYYRTVRIYPGKDRGIHRAPEILITKQTVYAQSGSGGVIYSGETPATLDEELEGKIGWLAVGPFKTTRPEQSIFYDINCAYNFFGVNFYGVNSSDRGLNPLPRPIDAFKTFVGPYCESQYTDVVGYPVELSAEQTALIQEMYYVIWPTSQN